MSVDTSLTVKQLRALAKERGLDVPGKARKAELLAALEQADPDPTPEPDQPAASSFDVVGEDGRRIVRGYSPSACEELISRIRRNGSDEQLEIVPSTEA